MEYLMLPELGEIRERRRKLGLTQKELANLVGISQSAIAKIERGKMVPNYNLAKRIFEKIEELECKEERKAKEIMSSPVIYVKPEDSVQRAIDLMLKNKISQLPVIGDNRVIGRINEAIILEKGKDKSCGEIMGLPFPIINEETPIEVVKNILLKESMVVVAGRNGKIVGVITRSDLMKV